MKIAFKMIFIAYSWKLNEIVLVDEIIGAGREKGVLEVWGTVCC
jgi:hypothetical protein